MTLQRNPKAKPKKHKCRANGCKNMVELYNSLQPFCSPKCGYAVSMKLIADRDKKAKVAAKRERLEFKRAHRDNDKKWWMKKATTVYNRWIVKVRDVNDPCISSGRTTAVQWQCGHYMPSTHSAIRFDEDNTHKQSSEDNLYRSGNLTEYRIRLIEKIGLARVERLEGPHEQVKYTVDDLKAIHAEYSQRLKDAGVNAS